MIASVVIVAQSCPTLCNSMDCSTPGFLVLCYLTEFAQIYVRWVSDAIQPSRPLLPPSPFAFNLSQHQGLFQSKSESAFHNRWPKYWSFSSASDLPMNIQDWFPLGLTGLISLQSKGLARVSLAPQFEIINSLVLSLLYSPILTSIHDHWKNHGFNYTDLGQQSDVSAF